jgi:hypothetical protein
MLALGRQVSECLEGKSRRNKQWRVVLEKLVCSKSNQEMVPVLISRYIMMNDESKPPKTGNY